MVAGGDTNSASGTFSFVGGGGSNAASGFEGIVTGGFANCAGGAVSWASGNRAKAVQWALIRGRQRACSGLTYPGFLGDQETFIWSDTQDADFVSSGANQFLVRADGGAMFNRNTLVDPGFDDFVIGRARPAAAATPIPISVVMRNGRSVAMFVSDGSGSLILNLPSLTAGSNRLQVNGDVGGTATLSHGGAWTNAASGTQGGFRRGRRRCGAGAGGQPAGATLELHRLRPGASTWPDGGGFPRGVWARRIR